MSATSPEDVKKEVRTYITVFVSLMVLTVITVAVSYLHMAVPIAITVALIIAFVKGSLVASFFMHLSHEKKLIYAALILTVVFFVFLIFIPLFTVSDQVQRGVPPIDLGAKPAAPTPH
jgi:cytochrome c oxidase subunit 4